MSGLRPAQKGEVRNPTGMTSATAKRIKANAELATKLRARMLVALEKKLNAALAVDEDKLDLAAVEAIQADILRLLKDTEDRGFGAPKASTELSGPGGQQPLRIVIEAATNDDSEGETSA